MKKVLVSIFTLIFIISMITVVNAASGSISVTASSNQVTRGNTFTVTVSGTADENITGMQASISYDTNKLSLENKSAGTNFSDLSGTNEIAIASSGNSDVKSGTLYTLTFKVLDTADLGETTISVTGATLALVNGSQAQENVMASDQSAKVTIISDTTTVSGEEETNAETTKTTTPSSKKSNSSSKSTSSKSSSKSSSNSSSKKTLPQTGVEVVSVIGIAVLSFVAIISYVSYRKYKNI